MSLASLPGRVLAILCLAAAQPAAAQEIALDGVWGNEAGCAFAAGGDASDEERLLLRPDGVESYATLCEWIEVLTARDGTQVATGLCGYEGEAGRGVETFVIDRDPADDQLVRIHAANGEPWGEVRRCR